MVTANSNDDADAGRFQQEATTTTTTKMTSDDGIVDLVGALNHQTEGLESLAQSFRLAKSAARRLLAVTAVSLLAVLIALGGVVSIRLQGTDNHHVLKILEDQTSPATLAKNVAATTTIETFVIRCVANNSQRVNALVDHLPVPALMPGCPATPLAP